MTVASLATSSLSLTMPSSSASSTPSSPWPCRRWSRPTTPTAGSVSGHSCWQTLPGSWLVPSWCQEYQPRQIYTSCPWRPSCPYTSHRSTLCSSQRDLSASRRGRSSLPSPVLFTSSPRQPPCWPPLMTRGTVPMLSWVQDTAQDLIIQLRIFSCCYFVLLHNVEITRWPGAVPQSVRLD